MYIGLGILLLVAGMVLRFDVLTIDLDYVNDDTLGLILLIAGVLAIVLSLIYAPPWRRRTAVEHTHVDPPPDAR